MSTEMITSRSESLKLEVCLPPSVSEDVMILFTIYRKNVDPSEPNDVDTFMGKQLFHSRVLELNSSELPDGDEWTFLITAIDQIHCVAGLVGRVRELSQLRGRLELGEYSEQERSCGR